MYGQRKPTLKARTIANVTTVQWLERYCSIKWALMLTQIPADNMATMTLLLLDSGYPITANGMPCRAVDLLLCSPKGKILTHFPNEIGGSYPW